MTLAELAQECHQIAVEHGWWDTERGFPECVALIHSEVSEMLQAWRKEPIETGSGLTAPVMEEMADILIRVFDLAGAWHVEEWLDAAVAEKMERNRQRPYRHGGLRA